MLNCGAEPKHIFTAKTNEGNDFPYWLGRTCTHDDFKNRTFLFSWKSFCLILSPQVTSGESLEHVKLVKHANKNPPSKTRTIEL